MRYLLTRTDSSDPSSPIWMISALLASEDDGGTLPADARADAGV